MFDWLKKKSTEPKQIVNDLGSVDGKDRVLTTTRTITLVDDNCVVQEIGDDFLNYFYTIPEVFWPIDFLAKRISEAHFDIRRVKDDSLVICDRTGLGKFLRNPNPLFSWRELVYMHFAYKLSTGNTFMRAAMSDITSTNDLIFRWCDHYWVIPPQLVSINLNNLYGQVPLFGIAERDEIIKGYTIDYGRNITRSIPPRQIWHDRDSLPSRFGSVPYITATSRLRSVKKNIANLLAVYEARNIIYKKRGAIGFLVSEKKDETGTVAMTDKEKENVRKEFNKNYGLGANQFPYGLTDIPMSFIRTNLSITELQPFEETLEDAIKIAAIYGIPSVLVPRKDQSTFSNQDTAEKAVYSSVIEPMAKRFCEELTRFLGLDMAGEGYYLDCNFDDVACMQSGLKEAAEVDKLVNEVCLSQFNSGLISINDWRGKIHLPALEGEIYDKVKFDMTPEELVKVDSIIKNQSPIQINTSQAENNNNPKTSTGEENGNN